MLERKRVHMITIREVASASGLNVSAIRYFEEQGLLPVAQRRAGRRVYEASILDRLALIDLAKRAGLSIREIRGLLAEKARRATGEAAWSRVADAKLAELDARIAELSRSRALLAAISSCPCPTLDDCGRAMSAARRAQPR